MLGGGFAATERWSWALKEKIMFGSKGSTKNIDFWKMFVFAATPRGENAVIFLLWFSKNIMGNHIFFEIKMISPFEIQLLKNIFLHRFWGGVGGSVFEQVRITNARFYLMYISNIKLIVDELKIPERHIILMFVCFLFFLIRSSRPRRENLESSFVFSWTPCDGVCPQQRFQTQCIEVC